MVLPWTCEFEVIQFIQIIFYISIYVFVSVTAFRNTAALTEQLYVCRWSSGVIMYTLLAGSPPFWHRKQMLMLRMILAGKYDFASPEWDDRSDTVKDLVHPTFNPSPQSCIYSNICIINSLVHVCLFSQISRLVVVNPKQRYTASEALNHPFFSQYVVDEVRQFSPYRRFKVSFTEITNLQSCLHVFTLFFAYNFRLVYAFLSPFVEAYILAHIYSSLT